MDSNNILNFQESTTILNACIKKCLETYWMHYVSIYLSIYLNLNIKEIYNKILLSGQTPYFQTLIFSL